MTVLADTATTITGVHSYADKFPMLSESELAELAESIKANGLRSPIVLTVDGLILDGRNRYAACQLVDVEPETVVYDGDDLAEYVIDCNSSRRHMTTGARAMATALVMEAVNWRKDGRWKYGEVKKTGSGQSADWRQRLNECGVILDFAPDLAEPVVNAALPLDAAYRKACDVRDNERNKLAEQERIAAEEADAKTFIEQNAPDLAKQVGGADPYKTFREAQAIWEQRNREEAQRLAKEKAQKAAADQAARENAIQNAKWICDALDALDGSSVPQWRERAMRDVSAYWAEVRPTAREMHTPEAIRRVAHFLNIYAEELENS